MYTDFFGFREKPFNLVPDPAFFYLSTKHRTAFTHLEYGLMAGIGFILLTGEVGTGKTTLIKRLLTDVGKEIEVAVVFNTNVTSVQLLELILDELELELSTRGKAGYLETLNQFLIEKHAEGRRVLLVVDEAQNLSREALEELRMLTNLHTDKETLLQILLVGQPSLRAMLQDPSLTQLSQRIAVNYHLSSLSLKETKEYIAHRLKIAGGQNEQLFTLEAIEEIFHYTGGIPRTINILCDTALMYAYADGLTIIGEQVIEQVVRDKQGMGFFSPDQVDKDIHTQGGDYQGNGNFLYRLESLEQRVNHLSTMLDWQMKEHEHRAERYRDALQVMLNAETKSAERLLDQYNLLKERLNPKEPEPEDNTPVAPDKDVEKKSPSFSLIENTEIPRTKEDSPRAWTSRFGDSIRKWFFL